MLPVFYMKRILPAAAALIVSAAFIICCVRQFRPPDEGMTVRTRHSAAPEELMTGRDSITDPRLFHELLPGVVVININTADRDELELLPGIGPALAEEIINYRTQNGPFENPGDIVGVKGISDAKFAAIAAFITTDGGDT